MVKKPRVNFRAYRKQRYLEVVFEVYAYERRNHRKATERTACPICQPLGGKSRVCAWQFWTCSFFCFRCGAKGDALELVRQIRKCSVMEAAIWLDKRGGPADSGLVLPPVDQSRGDGTIPD